MSHDITKLQRWLDLIACLVGRRRPVPVRDLMADVPAYAEKWSGGDETSRATARRTFERDKSELRDVGIPIETVEYTVSFGGERKEGYLLAEEDFYLPYLEIASAAADAGDGDDASSAARGADDVVRIGDEQAAVAVAALRGARDLPGFPLAREAGSALRKLTFDLDDGEVASTPVVHPDRPGAAETAARVRALAGALLAGERVTFVYAGIRREGTTDRDVAPFGLFYQGGEWYLVGSDAARDGDVRVFRVDRMEDVPSDGGASEVEPPDGFEIADFLDRDAWELGGAAEADDGGGAGDDSEAAAGAAGDGEGDGPIAARVLFRFPASLRVARQGRGELVEERQEDGAAVRRFEVRQVGPFLRWLLTFRGEAEVLAPAGLREELRGMARKVAELYGPVGGDGEAVAREAADVGGDAVEGNAGRGDAAGDDPDDDAGRATGA